MIAGFAVRCISPEMKVLSQIGYDLPHEQLRDLELLHQRLGVEYPSGHSHPWQSGTSDVGLRASPDNSTLELTARLRLSAAL